MLSGLLLRRHGEKLRRVSSLRWNHRTASESSFLWDAPPRNIMLVQKPHDPSTAAAARRLAKWLRDERGANVLVSPQQHKRGEMTKYAAWDNECPGKGIDLAVTLGGDGTLLHLSSLFQRDDEQVPPVLSFHLGSLGFLTPFDFEDHKTHFDHIFAAHTHEENAVRVQLRMRLRADVFDEKGVLQASRHVLNEVVIDRAGAALSHLGRLELLVDDAHVTTAQADGLIVSSPTGSTAYSMSAGGSMAAPNCPCMLVTPICPHTLSFRPLIVPDSTNVTILFPQDAILPYDNSEASGKASEAQVSFDGRDPVRLLPGYFVRISASASPLPSLKLGRRNDEWFAAINEKLHWNKRRLQQRWPVPVPQSQL
ncbi:MAG: hypothetical protein MHM6MM_004676 [Cercozoa sp. M6MM]